MSLGQADKLAIVWRELSAVVGNIEKAQDFFAFDPGQADPGDPVPFNIESSLIEALLQVRYIQEQVHAMAAAADIGWIVNEFNAGCLADQRAFNDVSKPI
ncbi:hypothetical protein VQ042_09265 [Aurantimonas sp. A2-1-M11]|uniref:hypothetical protein n=1 Tax=Aurantimonas sp. A2-1-M11 TaxID=3113712 RepID=UPI002F947DF0